MGDRGVLRGGTGCWPLFHHLLYMTGSPCEHSENSTFNIYYLIFRHKQNKEENKKPDNEIQREKSGKRRPKSSAKKGSRRPGIESVVDIILPSLGRSMDSMDTGYLLPNYQEHIYIQTKQVFSQRYRNNI